MIQKQCIPPCLFPCPYSTHLAAFQFLLADIIANASGPVRTLGCPAPSLICLPYPHPLLPEPDPCPLVPARHPPLSHLPRNFCSNSYPLPIFKLKLKLLFNPCWPERTPAVACCSSTDQHCAQGHVAVPSSHRTIVRHWGCLHYHLPIVIPQPCSHFLVHPPNTRV